MSTNEIKLEIERVLSPLVNEDFRYIYRAGNMLTLGFGEDVEYMKYNGQKMISAKYAIHVQTSWRISINDTLNGLTYKGCIGLGRRLLFLLRWQGEHGVILGV